ncbi:Hypothetical predicted protein [Paramuricea clavata]|uniref:Uncharacterized protein n=1 Tax=Paramuricea clavata TaxID=317549 RepID=A0A7D9J1K7_PARCT|nr:Hypothetical predicted protein [Paramuricea clavata]
MTSHGRGNATGYIQISVNLVCLKSDKIENERQKLKETVTAIQAMLNSEGGKVKLYFTNPKETSLLINVSRTKIMRSFTRKIEQYLVGTAGIQTTSANINLKQYINKIIVEVKRADVMIIQSYNLFLPTETQVVLVSPLEPLQRINDAILRREVVRNGTKLDSHCKRFVKRKDCRLREGKCVQVKSLKSTSSKCTTLADPIGLYLEIALQRAQGNLNMDILAGALSMVELIPQGIISASLLVLVATSSTMGNDQQLNQVSPKVLCEKALEHLQNVQKPNVVKTDLEGKAHVNLAQQQLGCSFSGNSVSKDLKDVDLDRAKSSITVVEQSIADEGALACYREIQFNNVLSILNYRHSQVHNDQSTHYLKEALNNYCRKAKRRAEDCQFQEMIEWAKMCEGLFTEELVRAYFRKRVDANTY